MEMRSGRHAGKGSQPSEKRSGCNMTKPFQIMAKPSGANCNIACTYCYYRDKKALYKDNASFQMDDRVLREFTRQYIQSQRSHEIVFAWQGGEPTLLGIDFFRKALRYQEAFKQPGDAIINTIQTNGILLDKEWCLFLKQNHFLVGLSMDGPADIHNAFRRSTNGQGTFRQVYHALQLLKAYQVEFNILCVVSRANAGNGREVYRFFRNEGVQFIQFISLVRPSIDTENLYSASALEWGQFLCDVFDQWVTHDIGKVFIMNFEGTLASWSGMEPSSCVHRPNCGQTMVIEHNGDLYSCDYFVDAAHRLGNIMDTDLSLLSNTPRQLDFEMRKSKRLPEECQSCKALRFCNGGCPADSILPSGKRGIVKNYYCDGYRLYFEHTAFRMEKMSSMLRKNVPIEKIAEQMQTGN